MTSKTYRWASAVPLIGGMTLAAKQVTGDDPEAFITYSAFHENERNITNYFPHVPYEVLNAGGSLQAAKGADFITALCPCAGLSTLGNGTQETKDKANTWMLETAKHVLGNLKPRVFWGENAPALYKGEKGKIIRNQLEAIAREHGYTVTYYFTNTQLHGVPQRRHRTFYFFWRENLRVPILTYWKRPMPSYGEYMKLVPKDASQHESDIPRATKLLTATRFAKCAADVLGSDWIEVIRANIREQQMYTMTIQTHMLHHPTDKSLRAKAEAWFTDPVRLAIDPKYKPYIERIMGKLNANLNVWDDSPSVYLPEGSFNALIGRSLDSTHPYEARALTTRECMHLMAMPHDFELVTGELNNICQNVPVCTAADMQRMVIAYLNDELTMVGGEVCYQNNFNEQVELIEGNSKLITF